MNTENVNGNLDWLEDLYSTILADYEAYRSNEDQRQAIIKELRDIHGLESQKAILVKTLLEEERLTEQTRQESANKARLTQLEFEKLEFEKEKLELDKERLAFEREQAETDKQKYILEERKLEIEERRVDAEFERVKADVKIQELKNEVEAKRVKAERKWPVDLNTVLKVGVAVAAIAATMIVEIGANSIINDRLIKMATRVAEI